MKQMVAAVEQPAATRPGRPMRRMAATVPVPPRQMTQPAISSPPNRPRQNSMVQTSVSIRRVNRPAVLKAKADINTTTVPCRRRAPCAVRRSMALSARVLMATTLAKGC